MMKNPFSFFKSPKSPAPEQTESPLPEENPSEPDTDATDTEIPDTPPSVPDDGFIEWRRTATRGGVERSERNDIYEAYSVYGADADGHMIHRYYHRYPEHERDFDLSFSRVLTFDELNRHLLEELDKGGVTLDDYRVCITKAERLSSQQPSDDMPSADLSEDELAALRDYCETLDTLKDKQYLSKGAVFRCSGLSVVGEEELWLSFRKPLKHDALYGTSFGVCRTEIGGYDIENLWILGVYNRLRERCERCRVILLRSEWNQSAQPVILLAAEGVQGVGGTLLVAVADADTLSRFGIYSLTFLGR